jgi:hypothetical protein
MTAPCPPLPWNLTSYILFISPIYSQYGISGIGVKEGYSLPAYKDYEGGYDGGIFGAWNLQRIFIIEMAVVELLDEKWRKFHESGA